MLAVFRWCEFLLVNHLHAYPDHYTLSLHDALPIFLTLVEYPEQTGPDWRFALVALDAFWRYLGILFLPRDRSEEHTSELQSQSNIVCRLLLEKKKSACTSLMLE